MKFESEIEENFYRRFSELNLSYSTSDRTYDVKLVKPINRNTSYDFSVEIAKKTIVIIEFKSNKFIDLYDYFHIEKYASQNNVRYIVLSDGEKYIITDRRNPNTKVIVNFKQFIELITKKEDIDVREKVQQITDILKEVFSNSTFPFLKEGANELKERMPNEIDYDEIIQSFSFRKPWDYYNIENRIFGLLLQNDKPLNKIYRYTTLDTIFSMLSYNSFRMNCLVGMNDTTEVNYAENYITGTNRDYTRAHWKTIDALNRRFISSCSMKEDDLTQWRLYSEDSKGVCLVLNVNEKLLNKDSTFILKRISYGKKDGKHPELDFIKSIIAILRDQLNIDFEFRTISTWMHFFKPFDYSVEQEVRLLYILKDEKIKKGWLLTGSHSILNPYMTFKLNDDDMPIHLTEIVLGPKCPEKAINLKQMEQFIRELKKRKIIVTVNNERQESDEYEYNIPNLKVSISRINNYR